MTEPAKETKVTRQDLLKDLLGTIKTNSIAYLTEMKKNQGLALGVEDADLIIVDYAKKQIHIDSRFFSKMNAKELIVWAELFQELAKLLLL